VAQTFLFATLRPHIFSYTYKALQVGSFYVQSGKARGTPEPRIISVFLSARGCCKGRNVQMSLDAADTSVRATSDTASSCALSRALLVRNRALAGVLFETRTSLPANGPASHRPVSTTNALRQVMAIPLQALWSR
jgi:hypothetical protein